MDYSVQPYFRQFLDISSAPEYYVDLMMSEVDKTRWYYMSYLKMDRGLFFTDGCRAFFCDESLFNTDRYHDATEAHSDYILKMASYLWITEDNALFHVDLEKLLNTVLYVRKDKYTFGIRNKEYVVNPRYLYEALSYAETDCVIMPFGRSAPIPFIVCNKDYSKCTTTLPIIEDQDKSFFRSRPVY